MSDYTNEFIEIKLEGLSKVQKKIQLSEALVNGTSKILAEWADDVKEKSNARVQEHRHPSGLFIVKGKKLPAPEYQVQKVSDFYYKVKTPRGKWNVPAGRIEMMRWSSVSQGRALVRGLDKEYVAQKGRNMYHNYDRVEKKYQRKHDEFMDKFEADVNKVTA